MTDTARFTLTAETRHEGEPVKGSRFIGTAAPFASNDDLDRIVAALRAEYPAATHHAFGWRAGSGGERSRAGDDGEPGGTAGRPILQRLEGRGITDAVVVVSRIFGGTKLGAGGLIRAYGGAAGMVLDRATTVRLVAMSRLRLRFGYEHAGAVERLLGAEGLVPLESLYGADTVTLELERATESVDELLRRLRDVTRGRIVSEIVEPD